MRESLREESHVCHVCPGDVGDTVVGMPIGKPGHGDLTIGACTSGGVSGGGVGGRWGRGGNCCNGGLECASWSGDSEWQDGGEKRKCGEEHD